MEKVTLPGLPDRRAADYQLDNFDPPRFARVVYVPQESKPDRKVIEVQAFEVNAKGVIQPAPNGAASRTPGTSHTVSMSGMGDTHTLVPGWVRVPPNSGVNFTPVAAAGTSDALPEGTLFADALPETGEVGQFVWVDPHLYKWDVGVVESIMRAKAEELAGLLRNSTAAGNFDL